MRTKRFSLGRPGGAASPSDALPGRAFRAIAIGGAAAIAAALGLGWVGLAPSRPVSELGPQDFLALNRAACGPPTRGALRRGLIAGAGAYAQPMRTAGAKSMPLMAGLGDESFPIRTQNAMAQAYFDQGLRLLYGFNHGSALASFKAAQAADPQCAMCYWGEAVALGPNINAPMAAEAYAPAYAAAQAALARADGASPAERALIEAVQARYAAAAPEDRSTLDQAYAEAMRKVAQTHPGSDLIQVLAVEAMMDTQPWAYWEADGRTPAGHTAEMLERLEQVLRRNPMHAGAIHLYIHTTEASRDPWRAEAAAERLDAMQLRAGHLQHMPAHIYFRIGRFRDSIAANIKAVAADEAYLATLPDDGLYRYGYYPHNVHFVLTSAQMGGDGALALQMAEKLDDTLPLRMMEVAPWIVPVKAAPWFAQAQYAEPTAVLGAPRPEGEHPYLLAAWRFARGVAAARMDDADAVRAEADEIRKLADAPQIATLAANGVPADRLLEIARLTLAGRAAMAAGAPAQAIAPLEQAADLQATLPYTEPPWWPYPVRRTLGAALLLSDQPARAEQEFVQTLVESPSDAFAYWGLAQARAAQGDRSGGKAAMRFFRTVWLGGRERPTLQSL